MRGYFLGFRLKPKQFGLWGSSISGLPILQCRAQAPSSRRSTRETPEKGTLLNPTYGSLKRDLIERVYIPKGPPNPTSYSRSQKVGNPIASILKSNV